MLRVIGILAVVAALALPALAPAQVVVAARHSSAPAGFTHRQAARQPLRTARQPLRGASPHHLPPAASPARCDPGAPPADATAVRPTGRDLTVPVRPDCHRPRRIRPR